MGNKNWSCVNWEDIFKKKKKLSTSLFNNTMTLYTKNWARPKKKKKREREREKEREPRVHVAVKMLRDKDEKAIRLIGHRMWA